MIGEYCREFRKEQGLTLKDVIEKTQTKRLKVGTLSAFEMGNSSNIKHLETYIKLSNVLQCEYYFMNNLTNKVLTNG